MPATPKSPPRWLDDREQEAWRGFLEMHARLFAQLNRELQDTSGISNADFAVLVMLSEHPTGRMRVLELARALRWEKSRLSHQLTRMEQRNLVARSHCSDDRRGAFVVLTPHGRDTIEEAAPAHVEAVRKYMFDGLTSDQVDTLASIATTVTERLDTDLCDSAATADDACG